MIGTWFYNQIINNSLLNSQNLNQQTKPSPETNLTSSNMDIMRSRGSHTRETALFLVEQVTKTMRCNMNMRTSLFTAKTNKIIIALRLTKAIQMFQKYQTITNLVREMVEIQ